MSETTTVRATVVGRSCGEQLSLRTEQRGQLSVRVRGRLWLQLDLGDPVWLEIGPDGKPCGIRPLGSEAEHPRH